MEIIKIITLVSWALVITGLALAAWKAFGWCYSKWYVYSYSILILFSLMVTSVFYYGSTEAITFIEAFAIIYMHLAFVTFYFIYLISNREWSDPYKLKETLAIIKSNPKQIQFYSVVRYLYIVLIAGIVLMAVLALIHNIKS